VRFLFLSLFITPARQIFRWPRLLIVRRMLGVAAFAYALAHFCFYIVDQSFDLWKVASEIALRIYLTIGFVALLGLTTLAATSTDAMVRRLGAARWRKLHRITYAIAVLATIHFFLQVKANIAEPTLMGGLLAWLFLYRLTSRMTAGWHPGTLMMFVLALAAGLGTAFAEAIYYALARGADPFRVLASDLSLRFGPRPAVSVLAICLAVALVAAIRRPRRDPAGSST
jgi:sulfoxide reductase heme-binding subunit YedZ